jgi:hypothetical protein
LSRLTLRIHAPSEEAAMDAAQASGFPLVEPVLDEDGEPTGERRWATGGRNHTLSVAGTRYAPQEDPEAEPVALPGWWATLVIRTHDWKTGASLEGIVEAWNAVSAPYGLEEVEDSGTEVA